MCGELGYRLLEVRVHGEAFPCLSSITGITVSPLPAW